MKVTRLTIEKFRCISKAVLHFDGHTLLVGDNNVGKSTVCEALELVLQPDRLSRLPVVEEYDFYNAQYLDVGGNAIPIKIEVVLTELSAEIRRRCVNNLEYWRAADRRLLSSGEIALVDQEGVEQCLRIQTVAQYNPEEDQFEADTYYAHGPEAEEDQRKGIPRIVKRAFGFLYLRALRTGSRALSLERGSLLDIILRMKNIRTGLWEATRTRLRGLEPPIDQGSSDLGDILDEIEARLGEYIAVEGDQRATRLFVSQLTREHLRKTIAFFLSMVPGQEPVPFQEVGTGTLNILVLALLTFIADTKAENVIFAMEEPEIALPPHTQHRIVSYLLAEAMQCFVTSHSPYVIERFDPAHIMLLKRQPDGTLLGSLVVLPAEVKAKTYRNHLRRAIAETMLGHGVIVGEGFTEQVTLAAAARKMEEADSGLFPLDLAGVTIVNTGGEGNLSEMGSLFKGLGLLTFAFYDQKKRKAEEDARIKASFDIARETDFKGMEALLAVETPIAKQWIYLEEVRQRDEDNHFGIPEAQPGEQEVRSLTQTILKATKGEAGAAALLEHCSVAEIPLTIKTFLGEVYAKFPRPVRPAPSFPCPA